MSQMLNNKFKLSKVGLSVISALAVSLVTSISGSQEAKAVGIIDNFNSCTPQTPLDLTPGGIGPNSCNFNWQFPQGNYANTTTADPGDIIGNATRNIVVDTFNEGTGSPPDGRYRIDLNGVSNLLTLNNDFGRSTLNVTYSGLSAVLATLGGGPTNGRFVFNILSSDATVPDPINISLSFVQGSTFSSTFPLVQTGATPVIFDFANFVGFNPNNPVTQIAFTIQTTDQRDIAIDSFGVEPVPFEYSQELGLAAVGGLFGAYKLRQRSKSKKNVEPESQD